MKKIEALLLVAVCILSFMCYKQHKQIKDLEYELDHLDSNIYAIDKKQTELDRKCDDLESAIDSLRDDFESTNSTYTINYPRNEMRESTRKMWEAINKGEGINKDWKHQ